MDIWKTIRSDVEFIAVITAIGALFLNIQLPENEHAKIALISIQCIWLIIITLSIIFLTIKLLFFSHKFEEITDKKINLKIQNVISGIIFIIFGTLVYYLWIYILSLYKPQFEALLVGLTYPILTLSLALYVKTFSFIFHKMNCDKINFRFVFYQLLSCIVVATIPALWEQFVKLSFEPWAFVITWSIFFLISNIVTTLLLVVDFFFEKKFDKSLFSFW